MSEVDDAIDQIESHAALAREQKLRAEIERLRADKAELIKKRNADEMQKMIDYWGQRAEKAEAEIKRLRAWRTGVETALKERGLFTFEHIDGSFSIKGR